jgi:hypothetical protein
MCLCVRACLRVLQAQDREWLRLAGIMDAEGEFNTKVHLSFILFFFFFFFPQVMNEEDEFS